MIDLKIPRFVLRIADAALGSVLVTELSFEGFGPRLSSAEIPGFDLRRITEPIGGDASILPIRRAMHFHWDA